MQGKRNVKGKNFKNVGLCIILSLVLVFDVFSYNGDNMCYAEEANSDIKNSKVDILEETQKELYNDNNQIVAYYYKLGNGGYIILKADGSDFIEYSLEINNFKLDRDGIYYYSGPRSIYKKENNKEVVNCLSKEKVDLNDISFENIEKNQDMNIKNPQKAESEAKLLLNEVTDVDVNKTATLGSTKFASDSVSEVDERDLLDYKTNPYNYNNDGRCGAVAAAVVLRYYYDHVSHKYIPSKYCTDDDGKDLINYLTGFINIGSDYNSVISGLCSYFSAIQYSNKVSLTYGINSLDVYEKIKDYITSKDKPLMVGLTGDSEYGQHWAVGVGYQTVYCPPFIGLKNIIYINDGWGNNETGINLEFIDGCVFIYR